jgi:hypothetical protein
VLNENGRLELPADAVMGLFNFEDCDATIRDLKLSGFDAGIVFRDGRARDPGREPQRQVRLKVLKVHIADTGRGILSLSSGDVEVSNSLIENTLWHGISVSPSLIQIPLFSTESVQIFGPGGAGIYFENSNAAVASTLILGAKFGGIVGLNGAALIASSALTSNQLAGIFLWNCSATILENSILSTLAFPQGPDDMFGHGMMLVLSDAFIQDNSVAASAQVGMSFYASDGALDGNTITCSALFDLVAIDVMGETPEFSQLTNNLCGCGAILGNCTVETPFGGNQQVPNAPSGTP